MRHTYNMKLEKKFFKNIPMAKLKYVHFIFMLMLVVLSTTNSALAQKNITVKGSVVERSNGLGIPSFPIVIVGAQKLAGYTDNDGNFNITVPENAELVFKYMGFKTQSIKLNGRTTLKVQMADDNATVLKQVNVIGYTPKTKEVTTGAAVTISGKDIQDVPEANLVSLLQGKVAGLNIQNNTGSPGARGSIFVRGLSNIEVQGSGNNAFLTPTSPLFVIDGVPIDANADYEYGFSGGGPGISPLSLIPSEDVEEITVLRDAQATSLYGSQGAYGVILITTKRGKSKTPIIQYTSNLFVNTPPNLKQVLGGNGERALRLWQIYTYGNDLYSARQTIDDTPFLADSLNAYYNNSTNWQDLFFRSTFNQTHNVSASGGDDNFNYKVNLGYYDENGIVENTGFKRYSLNMNTRYRPSSKLSFNANVSTNLGTRQNGSGNGVLQTGVASAASASSLLPGPSLFSGNAALGALITQNDNKTGNIKTILEAKYEFIPSLMATSTASYDYNTGTSEIFTPSILNNNEARVYSYNDKRSTLYNRNMLSFNKTFNTKHNLSANIFNEMYVRNFQAHAMAVGQTTNDQYQGPFGGSSLSSGSGILQESFLVTRSAAFASSVSYDYDKKYIIDVSYRVDGLSTSGPNAPWSKNPSVGLRWNFNKENFLALSKWLDYGSIRASWGRNIVPTGSVFDAYGSYDYSGFYNGNQSTGIEFNSLPNINMVPTTTTQYNAGLDVGVLNGKLQLTFDTYYKMVDNQLRSKGLSNITGFQNIRTNEVSLVNYGYELSATIRPLPKGSKLEWTQSFNGAINHDVLTSLPDAARQQLIEGGPTGQAILYRLGRNSLTNILYNTKGVYSTTNAVAVDPATGLRYKTYNGTNPIYFQGGDPYYADINGDYILDQRDMVSAGNSFPQITGGATSNFRYKEFSLNINMSYTYKRDILNNAMASMFQNFANPLAANNLVPIEQFNYWRNAGDNATYPNPYDYLRFGNYNSTATSGTLFLPYRFNQTMFQEDGSYLKINTITFSYTFNRNSLKRIGVSSMRVYFTANNVYTFTSYTGPDPENVSDLGRDMSDGYPSRRSYNLGLNVQF